MKARLLLLCAASSVAASSTLAADSGSADARRYAERAQAGADARLRAANVDLRGQTVSVRATVALDGRLTALIVVKSSGSSDTDRVVANVLRGFVLTNAPIGLIGGAVTLNVAEAPRMAAQTP